MRQWFFKIKSLPTDFISWRLSILLTLCLILGGTSQAILTIKLPLYLISLFIIGFVLTSGHREPLSVLFKGPIILGASFFILSVIYLIPLPPSLWTQFPGRSVIVEGFSLSQLTLPWLPISLTPENSVMAIWNFLPPIAITLILLLDLRKAELKNALLTVIVLCFLSFILGVLQIIFGPPMYLYEVSNFGYSSGFFSNANHQACFLTMALPICFYYAINTKSKRLGLRNNWSRKRIFALINLILIAVAIPMTDSITGYIIFILSGLLITIGFFKNKNNSIFFATLIGLGIGYLIIDFFYFEKFGPVLVDKFTEINGTSRYNIYHTLLSKEDLFAFFGTGPGSFYDVYLTLEDRASMSTKFANNAHNDYLEVLLELGLPGMLIMLSALFGTLFIIAKRLIKGSRNKELELVGAVSTLTVLIASLPDYPMRTIAISSLMTLSIIIMCNCQRVVRDYN